MIDQATLIEYQRSPADMRAFVSGMMSAHRLETSIEDPRTYMFLLDQCKARVTFCLLNYETSQMMPDFEELVTAAEVMRLVLKTMQENLYPKDTKEC